MKRDRQTGATTIEFALVLILFLMFMLAIVDFGRMLYTWNAATEATRAGARYAVVCDSTANAAAVLARMQALMPQIAEVGVDWTPAGCTTSNCVGVTVTIENLDFNWISPILGASGMVVPMPPFRTFLTREVMRMDPASEAIC
ncbi:TadE/TadG family type IV pilus assembly protein [Ramlibacter tataouinensis]|uniref:TadE/TadG family type IV pilus assembly protein n=1 Tax=Ramlibacter tataouinensis TaxID=94132 RepID=UPI0022F3F5AF|nr:TadE/TadG family type IV pilus assembly protein [Ramlibacter tataouinensis]WBY02604.1 TadE/TadG family type IV pilus assembly protein [Ramlibacter tataouinensis]